MYYRRWNGGSPEGDRSANGGAVHLGGVAAAQRLVQSLMIIKLKIPTEVVSRLGNRLVVPQINLFDLDGPPQPLQ